MQDIDTNPEDHLKMAEMSKESSSSRYTNGVEETRSGRADEHLDTPLASTSALVEEGRQADHKRESDAETDEEEKDQEAKALAAQSLESRRQDQLRKQNRFTKASVLIPMENFGIVEDSLYRSVSLCSFLRTRTFSPPAR